MRQNLSAPFEMFGPAQEALLVVLFVRQCLFSAFALDQFFSCVEIAENRRASIEAAPDRASTRDRTDAVNALRRAEDQRDRSARDLQIAILEYLSASGRLRVNPDGTLRPLPGMRTNITDQDPVVIQNEKTVSKAVEETIDTPSRENLR